MKSQIVLTVIYIIMCLIEIIFFSKSREKLSGLQEIQSLFKITPIMIPILYTIGCTVEGIVFERLPHILLILALGLIAYLVKPFSVCFQHRTERFVFIYYREQW